MYRPIEFHKATDFPMFKKFVAIAAMDLVTATIYIVGSIKLSGLSFWPLLQGKSRTAEH